MATLFELHFLGFIGVVISIVCSIITVNVLCGKDKKTFELLLKSTKRNYKEKLVRKAFLESFTDVSVNFDKGIEKDEVANTNLLYMGDIFESNDYIEGTFNNVKFNFSDIEIIERVEEKDKDGNVTVRYVTTFKGQWYSFDFHKKFKSNVKVIERKKSSVNRVDKERIMMEDVDFNNHFCVYAKDDIEAFYLLTPSTIEKIKKIAAEIDGEIYLGFVNQKLYIAINSFKDYFEFDYKKNFDLEEESKKLKHDMNVVKILIENLDLDNDLFKN